MERFDAIIVGAGPAGSTTAYRLARAGARVLLVDRARFPRDKPCGGGVTVRAARELPFSIDPVVEDVADRMELSLAYGRRIERRSTGGAPLCLMTQRRRLDAFLAEQAAAAGAEFRDGVRVTEITEHCASVDGRAVAADAVVGADGANGVAARALGLGGAIEHGVALEANVGGSLDRYAGRLVLHVGAVPGGYSWVFPKGDHVNVGVGGWGSEGPRLREHLARLCAEHRLPETALENLRGHRLPMRRAATVLARGRALVVGDAAGLVDPTTGDGMYEAFVSARLAAEAILDLLAGRAGSVEPYAAAVDRAIGPLAAASWTAKRALERFPRAVFALVCTPPAWRLVEQLVRGEARHPGEAGAAVRAPFRLVAALGR